MDPISGLATVVETDLELLEIVSIKTQQPITSVNITTDRSVVLYSVLVRNKTDDTIIDVLTTTVSEGVKIVSNIPEPLGPGQSFILNLQVDTSISSQFQLSIKPGIIAIKES